MSRLGSWLAEGREALSWLQACREADDCDSADIRAWDRLGQFNAGNTLQHLQRCSGLTVACYEVWQSYGGPEEGGWYYREGRLVWSRTFRRKKDRNKFLRKVVASWSGHHAFGHNMEDSNSDGEFEIWTFDGTPQEHFPAVRPHYE